MATGDSHTREQIFRDMFRELRAWNPEISESPERMDPILRILLQMYAGQLERIDHRVDRIWEIATQSLAPGRRLYVHVARGEVTANGQKLLAGDPTEGIRGAERVRTAPRSLAATCRTSSTRSKRRLPRRR